MPSQKTPGPKSPDDKPFPIVGIGASAGGLEAFTELLKHLPTDTGMGFVLVQHLDPQHDSALTQILSRATALPVHEITGEERVEANHIYVITPNTHLGIAEGVLKIQPRPQERVPHRPIDGFFKALAQDQCERAIGVVLSGTASDGTQGLGAIKGEGGITFAQDDSAKYDSMPRSAVAAGCVDFILSPQQIAQELARIARHPYLARQSPQSPTAGEAAAATEGDAPTPPTGAKRTRAAAEPGKNGYRKILLLLRNHAGVDFSLYKSSTIQRRITRRLVLSQETTLEDYARSLRGNVKELDALYADLLISVTGFFRNPEAFDALQRKVLPELLKSSGDDPLRVWVLGCSTGQEAYSIAMLLVEAAEKAQTKPKLQIFASDLNDALLEKARHGLYTKSLLENVTPERLRRFFVEEEGGYRIIKALRERIVFARQNLISDPPFSRMNLISCRNLLIYLGSSVQKKVLPTLHYALKPGGYLFLGASESIGSFPELFEPLDKKYKIYSKQAAPTPALHLPSKKEHDERPLPPLPAAKGAEGSLSESNAQREADRIILNRFAPPGVLINDQWQVLQFRGPTGPYLELPSGKASFDVLKLAREGLMLPLRAAINQARKDNQIARKDHVRVKHNGETRTVNLEVIPLKNLREHCFLILFAKADAAGDRPRPPDRQPAPAAPLPRDEAAQRIAELETELAGTRDYLQSIQEQYEAAVEELQAVNEETESANEELQSLNEELETSKEELESSNEELATVNEEMINRNNDLNRLSNDLVNLQTSTQLPIVLLSRDLTIRRLSAQAETQFGLRAGDVGRPLGHIRHNLVLDPQVGEASTPELERLVDEVIVNVRAQTCEVRDTAGRWYSLRVHPYLTLDNKVDGAVLVLLDIDALKRSQQAIVQARDYAESVVETVREPLLVLNEELCVEKANHAFYRNFQVEPTETVGRRFYQLGNRQWDSPRLRELLEQILPQNSSMEDFEVEHDFEQLGRRIMLLNARRLHDSQRKSQRILLAIEDITERKRSEEVRARMAAVVESSDDAIISKDLEGIIQTWNAGAQRLFGYTAQEAIGQPVTILMPPERVDEEPGILARIRRGERIAHYESIRRRKDGTLVDIALTISPISDAQGRISGASKIARDISERKRMEAALRESETQFRTLVEQVHDYAIFRMDVAGRATTWNTGVEAILGFQETEFIGEDIVSAIFTPEDIENGAAQGELEQAAAEGVANDDRWMRRKNGEHFFAAGVTTALHDDDGKLVGFTKVMRDQTAQQRTEMALRESELRYRRLFEASKDGILLLDSQALRIMDANPFLCELLGYSPEQLKGKELWEIGLFKDKQESQATLRELRETGYVRYEDLPLQNAHGATREVELIGNVYPVNDHTVVQCNIRDITERKQMERQIQQQANELAVASRRKDEFLAMLSHELRNPIAPIVSALQLIQQIGDENALHREAHAIIQRQMQHLSRLVDDLLEVSRITTGRIQLRPERVEVNAVIKRAMERVRPLLDRRRQPLSLSLARETLWLDADSTRLEQVFGNLLDNASKYGADDKHIALSVERDGGQAIIRVRDEGDGIDAATLPHLFELFSQAKRSLDRSVGGLGLGLALVKSLVELHGGTVEAQSEGLGQGSEFIVRLPLASLQTPPEEATAPPETASGGEVGLRVLVVDDNEDATQMLALLLRSWGYEVGAAYDGPSALPKAAKFQPQVILLDIGLPGMDGYEVARRIRQDLQFKGVRIVAVSGYGQDADRQRSQEAGFDEHLVKPVDFEKLQQILAAVSK